MGLIAAIFLKFSLGKEWVTSMGNFHYYHQKLPKLKFLIIINVDRKERGLPLPIQFRAENSKWVMVMVHRKERP